jgi:hypothetical protein
MHKLTTTDSRNIRDFNACILNRSLGLRVRFNFKTGRFALRDGDGKLQANSPDFSAVENRAEILGDRPVRLTKLAA